MITAPNSPINIPIRLSQSVYLPLFSHFQRSLSPLDPDLLPADSSCISDSGCSGQDAGYQYNVVIDDWLDGFLLFPSLFS